MHYNIGRLLAPNIFYNKPSYMWEGTEIQRNKQISDVFHGFFFPQLVFFWHSRLKLPFRKLREADM